MLLRLDIENFAIIKKSALVFGPGLTVFTGQTGAGKSILLDALSLCLGARADVSLIRHGEDKAFISAVFDIDQRMYIYELLSEHGIPAETNELVIRRIIIKDGNSRCFINDYPVSLNLVKTIANYLMEIHQQFDRMLDPTAHRTVLDDYAQHAELLSKTKGAYYAWKDAAKNLEKQEELIAETLQEKEFLEHKVNELNAFAPKDQEEEQLTELRSSLKQKDAILKTYTLASDAFEDTINTTLLQVHKSLSKLTDAFSNEVCEHIDKIISDVTDISARVKEHLYTFTNNSLSLPEIEDRLFALRHLARKYNCLPEDLPKSLDQAKSILENLNVSSKTLQKLTEEVRISREAFINWATELSNQRALKAAELDIMVASELPPLKLGQAQFSTVVSSLTESDWNSAGKDKVEFMVDINQQGVMLPLNKVASGGEIARLMLALKVCLARSGSTPGLVFDEVDSGVGGDVANAVGQRLRRLSKHLQVLVITHSPQVASAGDTHWVIEKSIGPEGVQTNPFLLKPDQRVAEIARMLSGDQITDEAKAAASVLLQSHT